MRRLGKKTHMVNEDDAAGAIAMMGETGATVQRVLD